MKVKTETDQAIWLCVWMTAFGLAGVALSAITGSATFALLFLIVVLVYAVMAAVLVMREAIREHRARWPK